MNQDKSESTQARYRRLQEEWRKAVRASDLVPAAKLVLHALQDYQMQERGTAWPGQQILADECGLSRRTVASALKSGREKGFIVPVGSESKGGRYGSVVYAFEIPGDPVQRVSYDTSDPVPEPGDIFKHVADGYRDEMQVGLGLFLVPTQELLAINSWSRKLKSATNNTAKVVTVQRRTGTPAFIKVDKSMNHPDRLFLSAPNISELTLDQSMELVAAILEASAGIWPEVKE